MNIFNKVTLQSMKKSRTRTIVTVIGVALSAAMITAVSTFAVSLQNYMVNGAIQKYGGWHVEFLGVPPSFVREQAADGRVADTAAFEEIGYAVLEGGKNPDKPYLFLAGFSPDTYASLPVNLISGRLPENSGEILIPAHVAANGGVGYRVDDRLTLQVGNRRKGGAVLGQHDPYSPEETLAEAEPAGGDTMALGAEKTYTVVGICERPGFEESTAPGYTVITRWDGTDTGDNLSVFVTLKQPRQVRSYADGVPESYARVFNDDVLRFMGLSDDAIFNGLLYSVVGILVALIMVGSIFLIYNSFTISLNDRVRQFGILLSVGATRKQLQNSVLFEGLCIGALGIPIGILVGIPGIKLVLSLVSANFGNIMYDTVPLTLKVSVPALAAAAAVSMATILISAYIPARKAAGAPVMECIRQTGEVRLNAGTVKTSKLAARLLGLEGTLALKNFKRNRRRYRSIVLSLTLSVVLLVTASTFSSHLKRAAEGAVMDSDYDICFCARDMDEGELFALYDKLRTADGVYESSYQAVSAYTASVNTEDFSEGYRESAGYGPGGEVVELPMDVQFIEDKLYWNFIESLGLSREEFTGPDAPLIAVAKAKKADEGETGKSSLINMFAGSGISLSLKPVMDVGAEMGGEPQTDGAPEVDRRPGAGLERNVVLAFVDTIPLDTLPKPPSEVTPYVFLAVAPYGVKADFVSPGTRTDLGLTFRSENPSQSTAEMEAMIRGAGTACGYNLYNMQKILEQNRNTTFVVDVFTYVFVAMISLIAVANVFNTISTNIRLRRRELAMLRSIGMSDRDFRKMMSFECILYGARTLFLGLPMAGILSWLIYRWMVWGGAEIDFMFPWDSMGISVLGVFLVVFVTMLYAVNRIRKENIIDALRDDMT
ncbi:ABC transporter permease [Enterocloster lavalensis]|uniref:ABC transporter permease n=1 Tax=Enterocloster lavalensis TaxID=460384 RepID=UPI002664E6F2|nr:ABC transporter permease [Enterocloster lavalensis]